MNNKDYLILSLQDAIEEKFPEEDEIGLERIAAYCKVSYSSIHNIRENCKDFRLSTICKVANALGYEISLTRRN